MEYCLVSSQKLVFCKPYLEPVDSNSENENSSSEEDNETYVYTRSATASLINLPKFGAGISLQKELKNVNSGSGHSMKESGERRKRQRLSDELDKSFKVNLTRKHGGPDISLRIQSNNSDNKSYLSQLGKVLGGKIALSIQLRLELGSEMLKYQVEEDLQLYEASYDVNVVTGFVNFTPTEPFLKEWDRDVVKSLNGVLTINLKLNAGHLKSILNYNKVPEAVWINKRLQTDIESQDVVLVAGNEVRFNCHKIFLTSQSAIFRAMFDSGMEEEVSRVVRMPDISSDGVHGLLDFLYCWDTSKASNSVNVAMELLYLADRYLIESLEKAMLHLIQAKENDWFSVSASLQIFQFAKKRFENENIITYRLLEFKSFAVLKSKSEAELKSCPQYQELFKNRKVGMDFCTYLVRNMPYYFK